MKNERDEWRATVEENQSALRESIAETKQLMRQTRRLLRRYRKKRLTRLLDRNLSRSQA